MLTRPSVRFAAFALLASGLGAQTSNPPAHSRAHPSQSRGWVETRLYFGLGPADALDQSAPTEAWDNFLDTEVTPRFPSGLSVGNVYGQWQRIPGAPVQRLRSKVLILDYPATPANAARIEAIRSAWKRRTGDLSVLRVTHPVDVSF